MTSQIKTVLLLALLSAIIIGLGGIMGGRTGIIIAFVIAMEGVTEVRPNIDKDPEYAQSFSYAQQNGVEVWHFACSVEPDNIDICSVSKD